MNFVRFALLALLTLAGFSAYAEAPVCSLGMQLPTDGRTPVYCDGQFVGYQNEGAVPQYQPQYRPQYQPLPPPVFVPAPRYYVPAYGAAPVIYLGLSQRGIGVGIDVTVPGVVIGYRYNNYNHHGYRR